ncbi:MAG TPA: phycobilisome rod-core linker polypeptide, partial [Longimicrobium sp.]|nr:phycobilisome rod-core linker polypeptide [Longimicrobium sp.]
MRLQIPGRALPRLALVLALCRGAGAAAQSLPIPPEAAEAPTRDDVVRGLFRQVLEREPSAAEVPGWRAQLDAGTTVRQLVVTFASTTEYRDRFITPYDSRTAAAFLYRHLLAREADPGGVDFWATYAAANGWPAAVSSMTASQEYLDRFGELAVPGRPVTAWDPRAEVMVEPRAGAATTERSLCLTVAAGGGAAYECGDLRLAHPLPSVRALNRVRAPTLIYNSQHQAAPFPLVAARVKPPVDMGTLDRIDAVLYVTPPGGAEVERARRSWQGAELAAWTPGQVRRIALRASDANGDATGSYFYRVVVTFTSGGTTRTAQVVGDAGVVNRRGSAFGAGWWLAGLERVVVVSDVKLFWVGGDGSARVYRRVGGTAAAFVAPVVDRPDTIRAVTDADYPGARYERRLSGGARVYFDAFGRHIATVNRLDQHTLFTYDAQGRLDAVWVPVGPGYYAGKVRYRFAYNAAGRLASIIAPDLNDQPARTVTVLDAPGDAMRVGGFRDPDQATVSFDYDAAGRIAGRTDQRGTRVEFGWDAGGKLASARVAMGGTAADIVTSFTAQESRGFAGSEGVGSPVAVEQAYTLMDGPRTDSLDQTRLWVDRWGGPWLVQDALGNVSRLRRDDWRLPALVTETRAPNGLVSRGWYNARGNPDSTTVVNPLGDGRNATTRYAYGNAYWPDFATQVTAPEGEVTLMDYDNATGNRIWQQPGTDPARRVSFGYRPADGSAAAGLPISVTYPQTAGQAAPGVERYDYDARGNLAGVTSPLGFRTIFTADLLGRVTSVRAPVNQAQTLFQVDSSVYDVMDRVAHTESIGPALNGAPEQRVTTDTQVDPGGLPLAITRIAGTTENITTRYRYDPAGRRVAEVAPDATPSVLTDNPVDSTVYDPAGNVREVHTRRADPLTGQRLVIRMEYDALNRMTRRITPAVHYD